MLCIGASPCTRSHIATKKAKKTKKNQRPNGPVNAHLIFIHINFVELENILFHAKFLDHRAISSLGEDF